jgi:NAD(P)-dependent dehydrogenase (short-subunit alcohol dehydrogenase family)
LPDDGSLTFTSGLSALRPSGGGETIAACSAAAVEALTRCLALEFAPLRVNCIAPGLIDTPLLRRHARGDVAAMNERVRKNLPVGHIGAAEEVAQAALLLMTNGYMTGVILPINGGQALT